MVVLWGAGWVGVVVKVKGVLIWGVCCLTFVFITVITLCQEISEISEKQKQDYTQTWMFKDNPSQQAREFPRWPSGESKSINREFLHWSVRLGLD